MSYTVLTLRLPEENTIAPAVYEQFSGLKDGQQCVDGLIQPINIWGDDEGGVSLYVNEEFLYTQTQNNVRAGDLATHCTGYPQAVLGNAYVSRFNYETGESENLTESDRIMLAEFFPISVLA